MLPHEYRLKRRNAFTATYKTGKSFYNNGITLFCGRNNSSDNTTKIGFVVSKKVHKRAVKRNRIRRLMRESVRLIIKNKGIDNKYQSLIFVGSAKLLGQDFKFVDTAVKDLLEKI